MTQLTPEIVEEVVFFDIPRKVSCDPEVAPEVIATLRAFFAYLERAHGLSKVARCASVVEAGAETKLRKRLSDPRYFGMAKSFVMGGKAAGFDTTNEAEWARMMSGKLASMASARPMLGSRDAPAPRPAPESRAKKEEQAQGAALEPEEESLMDLTRGRRSYLT